ncbi:MAG: hypothetical protein HQL13_05275 [Candidatus Omnitrophica bacterium]|nr:hypothetical protein [Candidatus Omnitrophota bacterium]
MAIPRFIFIFVIISFVLNGLGPLPQVHAQGFSDLPMPGKMVPLSPAFVPVLAKGLKVHPQSSFI